MNIGPLLRETRNRAGLTQEAMSPLVNISRSTISKVERNEMPIQMEDFIRWLQVIQLRMPNTTPIEAGITVVNGVDVLLLTDMLTQLVGGIIACMF